MAGDDAGTAAALKEIDALLAELAAGADGPG